MKPQGQAVSHPKVMADCGDKPKSSLKWELMKRTTKKK